MKHRIPPLASALTLRELCLVGPALLLAGLALIVLGVAL